jgi:hypothetical protein
MAPHKADASELGAPAHDRSRAGGETSAVAAAAGSAGGALGVVALAAPTYAVAPAQQGSLFGEDEEIPLVRGGEAEREAFVSSAGAASAPAPGAEFTSGPGGAQGPRGAVHGFAGDARAWGAATGTFTTPEGLPPDGNAYGGGGGAPWGFDPACDGGGGTPWGFDPGAGGAFGGAQPFAHAAGGFPPLDGRSHGGGGAPGEFPPWTPAHPGVDPAPAGYPTAGMGNWGGTPFTMPSAFATPDPRAFGGFGGATMGGGFASPATGGDCARGGAGNHAFDDSRGFQAQGAIVATAGGGAPHPWDQQAPPQEWYPRAQDPRENYQGYPQSMDAAGPAMQGGSAWGG